MVPLTGGSVGFEVNPELRGHDAIGTGAITDVPGGDIWRLVDLTQRERWTEHDYDRISQDRRPGDNSACQRLPGG
ncbi:hypothetical protein ACIGO9_31500 [Nocardia asteroides]|uniref:hypothetical protein n=1 Tax=Nocardia asteroides TaxID=1824 RepID=UPI0037CC1959